MTYLKGLLVAAALGCFLLPMEATARVLSDDEVLKNFEESRARLKSLEAESAAPTVERDAAQTSKASGTTKTVEKVKPAEMQVAKLSTKPTNPSKELDVMLVPDTVKAFHERELESYKDLGDIRVAVNIENATLKQIMEDIVAQAENKTGPWDIAWRLKSENRYLLEDKVNITAESNFDDFVAYMVDRVNNMSGVQLFVKVFNMSRVIVISDTYY